MNAIGQSLSRADGRLKVTGGARYTADISVAGAAHAAIVYSAIANLTSSRLYRQRLRSRWTGST